MNTMLKVTLTIAMFGSTILADGQMGSGGRAGCEVNCPPPPCTENCGRAVQEDDVKLTKGSSHLVSDVILALVKQYFFKF